MAEAAGFVGTAVGVFSLGVQVYDYLEKYRDDFNDRGDHVSKASAWLAGLRQSLCIICDCQIGEHVPSQAGRPAWVIAKWNWFHYTAKP